jgi:hypothetical protein
MAIFAGLVQTGANSTELTVRLETRDALASHTPAMNSRRFIRYHLIGAQRFMVLWTPQSGWFHTWREADLLLVATIGRTQAQQPGNRLSLGFGVSRRRLQRHPAVYNECLTRDVAGVVG